RRCNFPRARLPRRAGHRGGSSGRSRALPYRPSREPRGADQARPRHAAWPRRTRRSRLMTTREIGSDDLPGFSEDYAVAGENIASFRDKGWTLLPGVFEADSIEPYRPLIRESWTANRL